MTSVEGVERRINKYLWRWLGIPPSFTSVGLYRRSGQLQLTLSMVEEYKVAMTYRDSQDEQVGHVGVTTSSRRKWVANTIFTPAESMLKLCDMIGRPCTSRQGLETSYFKQLGMRNTKEMRPMIHEEVQNLEEEGWWSSCEASITGSLDQMGSSKEENRMWRTMEAQTFLSLFLTHSQP